MRGNSNPISGRQSVPARLVVLSDTHGRHREMDVPDDGIPVHAGDLHNKSSLS
jgi:hypothetical protein